MVLNSTDAPEPHYKMWNTRLVGRGEDPEWVMRNVASVARAAPKGKLVSLVINSHGCGARIGIGKGIDRSNASAVFSHVRGLISGAIYIVACRVAEMNGAAGDGNLLCCEICKTSDAYVYAPTASQHVGDIDSFLLGYGEIDDYEGTVYLYKPPEGSCVVSTI